MAYQSSHTGEQIDRAVDLAFSKFSPYTRNVTAGSWTSASGGGFSCLILNPEKGLTPFVYFVDTSNRIFYVDFTTVPISGDSNNVAVTVYSNVQIAGTIVII